MPTIEEINKLVKEWADKKKYQDFVIDRWAEKDDKLALLIRGTQGKPLTAEEIVDEA